MNISWKRASFLFSHNKPDNRGLCSDEKLGYFSVTSFPGAYKVQEKVGKKAALQREKAKLDVDRMLEI